jgi:hypothetical protein
MLSFVYTRCKCVSTVRMERPKRWAISALRDLRGKRRDIALAEVSTRWRHRRLAQERRPRPRSSPPARRRGARPPRRSTEAVARGPGCARAISAAKRTNPIRSSSRDGNERLESRARAPTRRRRAPGRAAPRRCRRESRDRRARTPCRRSGPRRRERTRAESADQRLSRGRQRGAQARRRRGRRCSLLERRLRGEVVRSRRGRGGKSVHRCRDSEAPRAQRASGCRSPTRHPDVIPRKATTASPSSVAVVPSPPCPTPRWTTETPRNESAPGMRRRSQLRKPIRGIEVTCPQRARGRRNRPAPSAVFEPPALPRARRSFLLASPAPSPRARDPVMRARRRSAKRHKES